MAHPTQLALAKGLLVRRLINTSNKYECGGTFMQAFSFSSFVENSALPGVKSVIPNAWGGL